MVLGVVRKGRWDSYSFIDHYVLEFVRRQLVRCRWFANHGCNFCVICDLVCTYITHVVV